MKKLVIAAGIALTIFTAAASTKAEAANNVLTKKEAAKKLAAAQVKAAEQKKTVSLTYKVKATKKNLEKVHGSIETLAAKEEFGVHYNTYWWYGTQMLGKVNVLPENAGKWASDIDDESDSKVTIKNGVATVQIKVYGKKLSKRYKEFTYMQKVYNHLQEATAGQSQLYKAAYAMCYQGQKMVYSYTTVDTSWETIWKAKAGAGNMAKGQCDEFAWVYKKLAMMAGVKHVAEAHIEKQKHMDAAVRLEDGRIFIVNTDGLHDNWFTEEAKESTLGNLVKYGWLPDGTVWDMNDYAAYELNSCDEDLRANIGSGEKYDLTWEDGKTESFNHKACQSALYSKYAW